MGRKEFPRLDPEGSMVRGNWRSASAGPPFEVREILDHPAATGHHHWHIGVRLGPFASGGGARSTQTPPPASRRVGVCEISGALSASGQVGYPPSMNTAACLGCSAMEYPSSEAAFTSCDVGRSVLVRLKGQSSKGHCGAKRESAQRASVGYCPRGAAVTRAAVPPPFVLRPLDVSKALGMQLWKEFGPPGSET